MNYLAHAWLSFNRPEILAGNMISDFVKGKKQFDYSDPVRKGIILHRAIDNFTDDHPATKELKQVFRPVYGLYAGAFTDIVYDYFLANDRNEFETVDSLIQFASETYNSIEAQLSQLPPAFQRIFPHMKEYDWLSNYRNQPAIQKSFAGLVYRAKYMSDSGPAFEIFENNISYMKPYYDEFFPLLKKYAADTLEELLNDD